MTLYIVDNFVGHVFYLKIGKKNNNIIQDCIVVVVWGGGEGIHTGGVCPHIFNEMLFHPLVECILYFSYNNFTINVSF